MMTKRRFLTGAASAAAVVAASSGSVAWSGPVASTQDPPPDRGQTWAPRRAFDLVVFNDRYSDARVFAQTLGTQGVPMLPIAGDPGTLWYGVLVKQVATGRRRLAGLGTPMDLMILESLAREADLRVRFRAQHDCRGRSALTHSICTGTPAARKTLAAELAGADWPVRLAAALARMPTQQSLNDVAHVVVATRTERSPDHPGMLVSWVLAEGREEVSVGENT
jgi:hypothetical protein